MSSRKISGVPDNSFAAALRSRGAEAGVEIEFIRKRNLRKEDRVKEILASRGEQAGLVCIFSAMEPCSTYKLRHKSKTTASVCITASTSW